METDAHSVVRLHVSSAVEVALKAGLPAPKAYVPNHYPALPGNQPTALLLVLRTTATSVYNSPKEEKLVI